MIIREPQDDPSMERILVLSSRPPPTLLIRQSHLYPAISSELLVNGQTKEVVIRVKQGFSYLLRLINANAHECPILLSVHGHSLQIISADGNFVQSMIGTHIVLFPGERLDAILKAEKAIGKYALDIQGLLDCRKSYHEAYILYENASDSYTIRTGANNFDEQMLKIAESGHHCHRISRNVICSLDLKSKQSLQLEEEADETIYVPFDTNTFSFFTDDMTDNSYNIETSIYYPAYLSLKKGVARIPQINGMSFKYPSSLILSQSENIMEKSICFDKQSDECADTPLFCECLQLLHVSSQKTIEIILIDEGFGGNLSHTFHLHGYNVSIMGQESFNHPITKDEILSLDRDRKIHRNLLNPVQKDTFVIPNKGYIILRFYTDNLGYWLWEARSTAIHPQLFGSGMQFIMKVGYHRNLPLVPIDFPNCGSNKGTDWLLQ